MFFQQKTGKPPEGELKPESSKKKSVSKKKLKKAKQEEQEEQEDIQPADLAQEEWSVSR